MTDNEKAFVNDAARQLLHAAAHSMDVQHVLDTAHSILKLPIVLNDTFFFNITSSGTEGIEPRDLQRNDDDDLPSRRRWMQSMQKTKEPLIDPEGKSPYRVMCYDVRVQNNIELAKLSIYETRPFNSTDSEILKLLASALACVLVHSGSLQHNSPNQALSDMLRSLINREIKVEELRCSMQYFDIPEESPWEILIMQDIEENTANYPSIQMHCFNSFGGASIIMENSIVCLLNEPMRNSKLKSLKDFLKYHSMQGGLSRTFYRLEQLRNYYLQASFALHRCRMKDEILLLYENCFMEDIIQNCSSVRDPISFCRPELLKLWEYDKKYNTQLISTLEIYCQCMCNMAETARACFLHYNSIKYRLRLIKEISGIDKINSKDLFELMFSFAILRQERGDPADNT